MAVQEQTPYQEITANGVTTSFVLDFDCENKDHLIVTLDGVDPPVGNWSLTGGAVVFTTAPASGVLVVIQRNTPLKRTTDYQSYNNSFRPQSVNGDFDRVWLKLQELGVADWILGNRIDALKAYVDDQDDELRAYLLEEIRKQGVALDQLEDYYNYLMQRIAQIAVDKGWLDTFVATWSGRTQESKNKEVVSELDFGIIVGSSDDQTAKFDSFLNYLRNNKCKGVISKAGRILVTANKTKIFGVIGETAYQELKYALDISGVDLTGIYKGYENVDGTIIDAQNTGCALLQAQSDTNNTTYSLTNLRVDNATVSLKMTYALMCRITNFVYKDSVNGVILGEPTFPAGAMSNVFTNIYGSCSGAPLQLLGKQWNNANQFYNCFWTGGEPSYIHVSGGYGAIANSFHGGEFNTIKDSKSSGLVLGNCRSTNFFGTYFEPRGHCIILDGQAKKVLLSGCTFGTTRSDATQSTMPCHIWHKSGAASVNIVGGSVFLGDDTGLQDNMRFVYSDAPSTFICNILDNPWAMTTGTTGWKIADITNVSKFESFAGQLTDSTPVAFSGAGGSISGLTSDSKVTYQINGKAINVVVDMAFDENTIFNTGNYYVDLLFNPKARAEGVARFSKAGTGNIMGSCSLSQTNKNLFLWIPQINATYNETTKLITASLNNVYASGASVVGYNSIGSRIVAQVSYSI